MDPLFTASFEKEMNTEALGDVGKKVIVKREAPKAIRETQQMNHVVRPDASLRCQITYERLIIAEQELCCRRLQLYQQSFTSL